MQEKALSICDKKIHLRHLGIVAIIIAFSIVALVSQLRSLSVTHFGYFQFYSAINYIEYKQLSRHLRVLTGEAINPWQYRILAPHTIDKLVDVLYAAGVKSAYLWSNLILRALQNLAIFGLLWVYYRRLGVSPGAILLGLSIAVWSMTQAIYDSDLSLNSYFEVIFYVLAALCALSGRYLWVLPITLLAMLNRETSGLIPLLVLAVSYDRNRPIAEQRSLLFTVTASLIVAAVVFFGVRFYYGEREVSGAYGVTPGLEMLWRNVSRYQTWVQLALTLAALPVLAAYYLGAVLPALQRMFWVVVPVWFVVHLVCAVAAETRLFLVPQLLVFVPIVLLGLQTEKSAR